ncbi:hypothetical protein CA13_33900 [Planctomycetes bacterium CA13]|uniref:Trm112 family protein n=1 Tax=Novipirellula herctigrandis TaxID=2527986 RepID=A0A5C5Z3Z6_9BACT|nr:hypothetical protein CA13_33900 [Planctomycetes bacterium CA13]
MIAENLLAILRCPLNGKPLIMAESRLVQRVNIEIARGEARDREDLKVLRSIDAGLMVQGGSEIYPIRDGIACMVVDEAIVIGKEKASN